MEHHRIRASLTIVSYFETNIIRRQRYNNVVISIKNMENGRHLLIKTRQKTWTILLKGGKCHFKHLMSHGLVTISYNNPRQDYMIKTDSKDDNASLLDIITNNIKKYEKKNTKSLSETVVKNHDKQRHIKDLAVKLKVQVKELTQRGVHLVEKKLTGLPLGFGDLEIYYLDLGLNLLGSKLDYWSWTFGQIRYTLNTLCLAENQLIKFPMEILALKKLKSLNLAKNDLRTVPASLFCKYRRLSTLDLSYNTNLSYLPFFNITVLSLNVSSCSKLYEKRCIAVSDGGMPDLKYLAGRMVLQHQLPYGPSNLPRKLITYLDNHIECVTCRSCVPNHADSKLVYRNSPAIETITASINICIQHSQCFECRNIVSILDNY